MPPNATDTLPSAPARTSGARPSVGLTARPAPLSASLASSSLAPPRRPLWRWFAAAALGVSAMALRGALNPWLDAGVPFVFAFPALVAAALLAGTGPALLTLAVAAVLPNVPLVGSNLGGAVSPAQTLTFLAGGGVVLLVCASLRRRAGQAADAAGEPQDEGALVEQGRYVQLWLRLLIVLALLLPAAFFASTAWQGRERVLADAQARINRSAVIAREHGLKLIHMNNLVLQQLQLRFDGWHAAQFDARRAEVQSVLNGIVRGLPDLRAVAIWDAQGTLQAGAGHLDAAVTRDVATQEHFRVHRAEDGDSTVFTSAPIRSEAGAGDWQVVVTQRRATADGAFDGIYAVVLNTAAFDQFYRDLLRTERSGAVTLLRADGTMLVRQPELPMPGSKLPPDSPLAQRMRSGDAEGTLDVLSPVDHTDRVLSFRRLNGEPLYVSASIRRDEVMGVWYRELLLLAAFTFPTALALAWVSWLALKHTERERLALLRWRRETIKRAQAEDALRQTQRLEALGHLTGGVAHDVNNLLMVVSNNAYLLRRLLFGGGRGTPPSAAALARAEKPIDAVLRAVTTGSRLTRQLLAFARQQALQPQAIRLQERLPMLLDLMRHSISAVIALEGDCRPDTPAVLVDPAELELAMINLAVNARDAMPDGGRLRVEIRRAEPNEHQGLGDWVSITVSDTGVGIAQELVGRVFEPFFTTKEQGKGTGLGLSQVYGFCQQAGGTARIDSTPGVGTRVQLLLPATQELPESLGPAAMPVPNAEGRLLLVEDNVEVADATEPMLSSWGYAVRTGRSGDAAKAMLLQAEGRFDLLLTDIVMPGSTDGLSLARHVRERYPHIGIVLMTGHAKETDKAMAEGFVVLQKPWTPPALSAALEKAHPRQRA